MTSIRVSAGTKADFDRIRDILGVDDEALMKRLLKLPEDAGTAKLGAARPTGASNGKQGLVTRYCVLPAGLKLRLRASGQEFRGVVVDGGIRVDGLKKLFKSPSGAAREALGYHIDGWAHWEYEDAGAWKPLNNLRPPDSIRRRTRK